MERFVLEKLLSCLGDDVAAWHFWSAGRSLQVVLKGGEMYNIRVSKLNADFLVAKSLKNYESKLEHQNSK